MEGYIVTDSTTGQQKVDINEWAREFACMTYVGARDNYIPGSQFHPGAQQYVEQRPMGGQWLPPTDPANVIVRQILGRDVVQIINENININGCGSGCACCNCRGEAPMYRQPVYAPQPQFAPQRYYAETPQYSQLAYGPQGRPNVWYYRQPDYRLPLGYNGPIPLSNLPAYNGPQLYESPVPYANPNNYWYNGQQYNQPYFNLQNRYPIQQPNYGPQYVPQRQFGRTTYGDDPNYPALQMTINSMLGHSIRDYDPNVPPRLGCARFVSAALNRAYHLPVYDSECNALERDLIGLGYQRISYNQIRPGDVIIGHRAGTRPGHAAIYVGNGQVANNSSVDGVIEIQSADKFNAPDYVSVDVLRRTS